MNLKFIQLSVLFFYFISNDTLASDGKISLTAGHFTINAKANGKSSKIGNPSVLKVGYQHPVLNNFEIAANYTILLADFAGTDLGYGLDLSSHYYPFTSSHQYKFKDDFFEVKSYSEYSPFLGIGFFQRQFQSIKNSYAGFGGIVGIEKYFDKWINFKGEARYISLSGSGDSEAAEINLLFGIVYKL